MTNEQGLQLKTVLARKTGIAWIEQLVHRRKPAHDHEIADLHVPGEGAVVRENHRAADRAIMAYVAVGEEVPDSRCTFCPPQLCSG